MDRLKGIGSFVLIAAGVMAGLRVVHLAVPVVFPETRQGPVAVSSLDEVRRRIGFAPILPAYRPAILGEHPSSLAIRFSPSPTFVVTWQEGGHYLSVTQQRGGPKPAHPPLARPLVDVADSIWWVDGARSHLIVSRGGFWIHIETSLDSRDLRRFADTLTEY